MTRPIRDRLLRRSRPASRTPAQGAVSDQPTGGVRIAMPTVESVYNPPRLALVLVPTAGQSSAEGGHSGRSSGSATIPPIKARDSRISPMRPHSATRSFRVIREPLRASHIEDNVTGRQSVAAKATRCLRPLLACLVPGIARDSTQPDRLSRTTRLPGEIPVRALQDDLSDLRAPGMRALVG
jgi:hypothetical protein